MAALDKRRNLLVLMRKALGCLLAEEESCRIGNEIAQHDTQQVDQDRGGLGEQPACRELQKRHGHNEHKPLDGIESEQHDGAAPRALRQIINDGADHLLGVGCDENQQREDEKGNRGDTDAPDDFLSHVQY